MKSELSQFVAKARKELGYTQEEFAARVGVGLRFLRELEQGKESLRLDKVNQVLSFVGAELKPVERDPLAESRGGHDDT